MTDTSKSMSESTYERDKLEKQNELDKIETIYSGKVIDLVGIPIKHQGITEERIAKFHDAITLVNPDSIVAEYFDPDMPDEIYNRIVTEGSNKFSAWELKTLLEFAGIDKKVICLDPAHDNTWFIVDGVILELGFLGIISSSLLLNEIALRQKVNIPKTIKSTGFFKRCRLWFTCCELSSHSSIIY